MSKKFEDLRYEDFRRMASDCSLSSHEKIGFPDSYRAGYGENIHKDILNKLTNLCRKNVKVLDIGPGCAELPRLMIKHCQEHQQFLVFVDSEEMLSHFPDQRGLTKVVGFFPDCADQVSALGKYDVIICYSVFHYIFKEASFWRFLDISLNLLSSGGQMLIGDIPNVSKRKRFFSSASGIKFHKDFMKTDSDPDVDFCSIEYDKIDDAVILGMIMRARAQGCDAYWMPQPANLPMHNRREDILIVKA
jgi:2-polyprenyl-3-methyl-5-hydroxy-6-metoxy-1,4-benzoquinol methylase